MAGKEKTNGVQVVKAKSAPEIVAADLVRQIESHKLKPGQKLEPQSELSKMFNVGMSSIREAVNVLEVMGYLRVIHGSGTFVSEDLPISKTMIEKLENDLLQASFHELLELRELLECHAVRQAAHRADPLSVKHIRAACEALRRSTTDRQAFLEFDLKFHLTIARTIDMKATAAFIALIFEIMHKHFNLASITMNSSYRKQAIITAEQVVQYIDRGDESLAARCMRRHLDLTKYALAKTDGH